MEYEKALSKQKNYYREWKRKVKKGASQQTKEITMEPNYNKFAMHMLKHKKATS